MSWYSPKIGSGSPVASSKLRTAPNVPIQDHGSLHPPQTPESVKNLGGEVCYDVGAFRELMRQYRQLDDSVTTRLNRALARARSSGLSSSPSLLDSSSSSSGFAATGRLSELGTSTYSTLPQQTCLDFWRELSAYWKGREDVIRYCVSIVDATIQHKQQKQEAAEPSQLLSDSRAASDFNLLDADKAGISVPPSQQQQHEGYQRTVRAAVPLDTSLWDARGSRAESTEDGLRRHLHNEEAVDRIIRHRSLQAFKSRCNFFRLPADASPDEKRMWEER